VIAKVADLETAPNGDMVAFSKKGKKKKKTKDPKRDVVKNEDSDTGSVSGMILPVGKGSASSSTTGELD